MIAKEREEFERGQEQGMSYGAIESRTLQGHVFKAMNTTGLNQQVKIQMNKTGREFKKRQREENEDAWNEYSIDDLRNIQ